MNKLIIVGAGGFGREVLQWALQSHENNVKWEVAGFLDDNLDKLKGLNCPYPILGAVKTWRPKQDERFVLAIGSPQDKEKMVELLSAQGAIFENVIHRSVVLATTALLGTRTK